MVVELKDGRVIADCDPEFTLNLLTPDPSGHGYKYIKQLKTCVRRYLDKDGNILFEEGPANWTEYMIYRQSRGLPCVGADVLVTDMVEGGEPDNSTEKHVLK
jgi:hypothetical protein